MWKQSRFALEFFAKYKVPFQFMTNANDKISAGGTNWCLADRSSTGSSSLVLDLPSGGTASVDLADTTLTYNVYWYDPRNGGDLQRGSVTSIVGKAGQSIGLPPKEASRDWVVLIR
jgi:Putative collagen-binding domain of a collagenase